MRHPALPGEALPRRQRVAFVNTHPIQYFAPLYAYLNHAEDLSVTALYLSDYSVRGATDRAFGRSIKWDIDLLEGYEARFVPGANRNNEPSGFFSTFSPALWGEIAHGQFDAVVVHGHTPAAMLVGAAAARAASTRLFFRAETHLGLARSRLKIFLRRTLVGVLYRSFDGVLAIGTRNREFYRALGVKEQRIFSMPYTVDNKRFGAKSGLTDRERYEVRRGLGVRDEKPIVLYAAKFQTRKRPGDLLLAAAQLKKNGHAHHIAMVGSGALEGELRAAARQLELDITFVGFVNQSRMPALYHASDVFVLPSEDEPWGLAINEAMCAGLPIVASESVGCVPDLVQPGRNGFTFKSGDIEGLVGALRPLLADKELRRLMALESRAIIADWSYEDSLAGLRLALSETRYA